MCISASNEQSLHTTLVIVICSSRGVPLLWSAQLKCTIQLYNAHIHCLASIDIQQASMDVSGSHYFHVEEVSDTPCLCTCFHIKGRYVRLPLCFHLSHGHKIERCICGKVQPLLPCHQHPPLLRWANITK